MRESELLKHIYDSNDRLGSDIVIPPGDDMGMICIGGVNILAAVDQLVAGRHFQADVTPLDLVGRKAMTRNLSDVAAMAAIPRAALAAVALPQRFGQHRATQLFDAMRAVAEEYRCPLIGGDIAVHAVEDGPLTCTVTVFAEPSALGPVLRSRARAGDAIYVTGQLGGSLGSDGLGKHLTFVPRIETALKLHEQIASRLHAMIDISDGLGRDAANIARASQVQLVIDSARIPLNDRVTWQSALHDGEDYELLFTADGDVPRMVGTVPITQIGEVGVAGSLGDGGTLIRHNGKFVSGDAQGWEHVGS